MAKIWKKKLMHEYIYKWMFLVNFNKFQTKRKHVFNVYLYSKVMMVILLHRTGAPIT